MVFFAKPSPFFVACNFKTWYSRCMITLHDKKWYEKKRFSSEKVAVVQVASFDSLGRCLALDLLLWIEQNPNGVISLPTGRTPESFIRALRWYKENWNDPIAQKHRKEWGVTSERFPDTQNLTFVQIDEFLWMSSQHKHSYARYILEYYIPLLEISRKNCLLMDFSEMGFDLDQVRAVIDQTEYYDLDQMQNPVVHDAVAKVQQFCEDYERKINQLGGIGYFLGGIGLDGHVAFNVAGSSRNTVTRIVEMNKKSKQGFNQQNRYFNYAVTIGMKTILCNPKTRIVLGAAGKVKSQIVRQVVEDPVTDQVPASFLQEHKNAHIVVTQDVANCLTDRMKQWVQKSCKQGISVNLLERVVVQVALDKQKRVVDLQKDDFKHDVAAASLYQHIQFDFDFYVKLVELRLKEKINQGLQGWNVSKIMHTAPHHDDIMLGYLPVIMEHRELYHHMMYVVSGANGVSDKHAEKFREKYPNESIRSIKMSIREQEAEALWNRSGLKYGVSHMRSAFYSDSYFKSEPTFKGDVSPCLNVLQKISPGLILVQNDSEFQGPTTHHVSFKVIMEAVRAYDKQVPVWGYRNVWDRYRVDEAAFIMPVHQDAYDQQHQWFIESFQSQKKALYPTGRGDEPFSVHAQAIQKEQYQEMVVLLGEEYFKKHADQKIRSACGFIFFEKIM